MNLSIFMDRLLKKINESSGKTKTKRICNAVQIIKNEADYANKIRKKKQQAHDRI